MLTTTLHVTFVATYEVSTSPVVAFCGRKATSPVVAFTDTRGSFRGVMTEAERDALDFTYQGDTVTTTDADPGKSQQILEGVAWTAGKGLLVSESDDPGRLIVSAVQFAGYDAAPDGPPLIEIVAGPGFQTLGLYGPLYPGTAASDPASISLEGDATLTTLTLQADEVTIANNGTDAIKGLNSTISFPKDGTLTTGTGARRWYADRSYRIVSARASVGTAPTGASIKVDVNKNGTTIYTTQANRPTIAISANVSTATSPDVTTLTSSDYLTVDIDQIGSTIAGADLNVVIVIAGV